MTSTEYKASVTAIERIDVGIFHYDEKSSQPIDMFKRKLVTYIQKTSFFNFNFETDRNSLRRLDKLSDKWRGAPFLPYLNVLSVMLAFYIIDKKNMDTHSQIIVFYDSLPRNLKQHTTKAGLIRYSKFIKES